MASSFQFFLNNVPRVYRFFNFFKQNVPRVYRFFMSLLLSETVPVRTQWLTHTHTYITTTWNPYVSILCKTTLYEIHWGMFHMHCDRDLHMWDHTSVTSHDTLSIIYVPNVLTQDVYMQHLISDQSFEN